MNLSGLVGESIAFESGINSRKQALGQLAEQLAQATGLPASEIAHVLGEREQLGTTGFGGGAAIPHGRMAGLDHLQAAIIRLDAPIDWEAMDGAPVDLVVGLIGPDEGNADFLKALALISRTLREQPVMDKWRGAADVDALSALIAGTAKAAA